MRTTASWPAWALGQCLLFALWIVAYFAAGLLEYAPFASLWFPPAAVTFAAFAVFRWRALPALLAPSMCSTLITVDRSALVLSNSLVLLNGLMFAVVHCLAYALAAALVLRSIRRNEPLSMARTVGAFLLGGMLAAAVAAFGGAWATYFGGMIPRTDVRALVLPWLIGDYAGLVAMGPLLVLALRTVAERLRLPYSHRLFAFDTLPRPEHGMARFVLKLALMLGTTGAALFAIAAAPDNEPVLFAIFAAIILQLWIVHTQGAIESLIAIALFSATLAVLVATLGLGAHALILQFAMITLAAGSYFGLAVPMLYADNAQLRRLLIHDSLTGAYSRHFFVELSQQAIRQSQLREMPASMLMIDLDHLKSINDQRGHAAGDLALVELVRACQRTLSANDLLGRLGGDEFCALLPGLDRDAANEVATRIIAAMKTSASANMDGIPLSVSIGVATTQSDHDRYESLLIRADTALYAAKRGGRDRIAQIA